MQTLRLRAGWLLLVTSSVVAAPSVAGDDSTPKSVPDWTAIPTRVDAFHPDARPDAQGNVPPLPKPAYGGRVILHMEAMPKSLCWPLESASVIRRILYETNETMLLRNWETGVLEPDLCTDYVVEDLIWKNHGPSPDQRAFLFGRVREDGDAWVVTPLSNENPLREEARVSKSEVSEVLPGVVITFHLRSGVKWHDGHPFDARDVRFSFDLYSIRGLRCEEKLFQFQKVRSCEEAGPLTVRFFFERPYFNGLSSLGDMAILPSHLYDLDDPDNAAFDPSSKARRAQEPNWKPSAKEKCQYIESNPHNREWIGLGPYRVSEFGKDFVEATRFDDYFDPSRAGYVDTIRWRAIPDFSTGFQALLNGQLDYFDSMTADDYFGSTVEKPLFTDRFYRGLHESPVYWYIGWNTHRPMLQDPIVRRALAHLFDFDEFARTYYRGIARQVTAHWLPDSPAYDRALAPYPFDPKLARKMLADAGWYDRDNDGIADKDGIALSIELLIVAGNVGVQAFAAKFQENLKGAGVQLRITTLEWGSLNERKKKRDFDALALGWSPAFEGDPEQVWHSRWGGDGVEGSNFAGLQDPEVDGLIERGQRQLDSRKRNELWHLLHRRVYELQPYLFCYNVSRRFAMSKQIRGFQSVKIDPNFVVRRWYYPAGTPGTRLTRERAAK